MNLEYYIVGIAKGSTDDLTQLYTEVHAAVYALALATVKDKMLAREIAIETFRRVKAYAHAFDTDLNAEYWILDMARQLSLNALHDPSVAAAHRTASVDNATSLVLHAVSDLKGERGVMLALRAASQLSYKDIASLTGFYRLSVRSEVRRGIRELAELDRCEEPRRETFARLRTDLAKACPDYRALVLDETYATAVSHISHEALYLSEEEAVFSRDEADVLRKRADGQRAARRKKLRAALIAAGAAVLAAAIITGIAVHLARADKDSELLATPRPSVQFGNTIQMLELDGRLYYCAGDGIYRCAIRAPYGAPERISTQTAREMTTDGTSLFFRSSHSSTLYAMEADGSGLRRLTEQSGTTLTVWNGYLYFSGADGIYRVSTDAHWEEGDAETAEAVYTEETDDAPMRDHMGFASDGRLFFSGGSDTGIYELTEFAGSPALTMIYFGEAYYFQIYDDFLYFDALTGNTIGLYAINLANRRMFTVGMHYDSFDEVGQQTPTGSPVYSYSAAYYAADGVLYYEGYRLADDESRCDIGLYRLPLNSTEPELLFEIAETDLHISEIFVSGDTVFCYYSDGISGGVRCLKAVDCKNPAQQTAIFQ